MQLILEILNGLYKAVVAAQAAALSDRALHSTLTADNRTAMPIPDNAANGIVSPISITAAGTLQDIKVYIEAEHEFLGDVSFTLQNPQGLSVLVQSRTLGRQTRLQRTYSLISTPALRRLLNTEVKGRWQLQVVDYVPLHVGKLRRWELVLGI